MSKGSKQRPTNKAAYDANYDAIFGKKDAVSKKLVELDNEIEADKIVRKLQTGYATEEEEMKAKIDSTFAKLSAARHSIEELSKRPTMLDVVEQRLRQEIARKLVFGDEE